MNNEVVKLWVASTDEQMEVEMPLKWHEKHHAQLVVGLNEWTNESINPRIDEARRSCTIESMNELSSESMNHWSNESINQWISESMSQKIDQSTSQ